METKKKVMMKMEIQAWVSIVKDIVTKAGQPMRKLSIAYRGRKEDEPTWVNLIALSDSAIVQARGIKKGDFVSASGGASFDINPTTGMRNINLWIEQIEVIEKAREQHEKMPHHAGHAADDAGEDEIPF